MFFLQGNVLPAVKYLLIIAHGPGITEARAAFPFSFHELKEKGASSSVSVLPLPSFTVVQSCPVQPIYPVSFSSIPKPYGHEICSSRHGEPTLHTQQIPWFQSTSSENSTNRISENHVSLALMNAFAFHYFGRCRAPPTPAFHHQEDFYGKSSICLRQHHNEVVKMAKSEASVWAFGNTEISPSSFQLLPAENAEVSAFDMPI